MYYNNFESELRIGIKYEKRRSCQACKKKLISIQDKIFITYADGMGNPNTSTPRVRRTTSVVIRSTETSVIWPGQYTEAVIPQEIQTEFVVAVEPHGESKSHKWISPEITDVGTTVRIYNKTLEPQLVRKHDHLCHLRDTKVCDTSVV